MLHTQQTYRSGFDGCVLEPMPLVTHNEVKGECLEEVKHADKHLIRDDQHWVHGSLRELLHVYIKEKHIMILAFIYIYIFEHMHLQKHKIHQYQIFVHFEIIGSLYSCKKCIKQAPYVLMLFNIFIWY